MRIIAGEYKGRTIKAVPGKATRPTSDKLKEAIFHKLGPFFDGGNCLDLFAGSGALGIEALSRGMDKVVFIDKQAQAVKTIKQNINILKATEHVEVYRNDAFRAIVLLEKRNYLFDLILLDPPYDHMDYEKLLHIIQQSNLINKGGLIYVEHRPQEPIHVDEALFTMVNVKKYSNTTSITILQKI